MPGDCARPLKKEKLFAELNIRFETAFDPALSISAVNGQHGRCGVCYWLIGWLKQPETEWKELRSPSIGEKSEVADAHKAARQQVQEAAQELIDGQSHDHFLLP